MKRLDYLLSGILIILMLCSLGLIGPEPPVVGRYVGIDLVSPTRMAVAKNGKLLISDNKLGLIVTVDPVTLKVLGGFRVANSGRPLAVGSFGKRIYVGNETLGRVEVYSTEGKLQGTLGGEDFTVGKPTDLVIDEELKLLFVVDGKAKDVKVFSLDTSDRALAGRFLYSISEAGMTDETFQFPTGIAINPASREVYVSDYGKIDDGVNPRVMIFTYEGTYVKSISGKAGMLGYRYAKPQGLWVDDANHIFVVEGWGGQVVVMDRNTGAEVAKIGSYGVEPGQLSLPLDIVILGANKDLYITNNYVQRIEMFPEGGKL